MFQIIKENLISFLIVILVTVACGWLIVPRVSTTYNSVTKLYAQKKDLKKLEDDVTNLKVQAEMKSRNKSFHDGKKIYEIEGVQFSADASFAPLFENVLSIAQNSGIRIRSIAYNYAPEDDPIYASRLPNYNTCELTIVAVGTYTELQNFFKGMMKDPNLSYLAEVEMKPWDKDKTILISSFKLRLYTKTPGQE